MPRRYIIDVPPEWLSKQLDSRGRVKLIARAKPLTATVGERVIERQCQKAAQQSEPPRQE